MSTAESEIRALIARQVAMPFPPGCRGREIDGIDLVLVDAEVHGAAANYLDNSGSLTAADARYLERVAPGLARMIPKLPNAAAKDYYVVVRDLAHRLLARDIPGH